MEIVLAYIDPGSGSLVIQALIAGLVAVPVIFRSRFRRLATALRGGSDQGASVSTETKPRT